MKKVKDIPVIALAFVLCSLFSTALLAGSRSVDTEIEYGTSDAMIAEVEVEFGSTVLNSPLLEEPDCEEAIRYDCPVWIIYTNSEGCWCSSPGPQHEGWACPEQCCGL